MRSTRQETAGGEVKRLRRNLRRLNYWMLVEGVTAIATATIGLRAAVADDDALAVTTLVPTAAVVLLLFGEFIVSIHWRASIGVQHLKIETEDEAGVLDEAGGLSLGPFMAFSHQQMTKFECIALSQATLSHFASLLSAALGFVVLVVGAGVTLTRDATGDITVGAVMTAVGAALAAYLSRTFLATYKLTTAQMSYYYGQPEVNCYLLHAERLLVRNGRDLSSKEGRNEVLHVIDSILQIAADAQRRAPAAALIQAMATHPPTRRKSLATATHRALGTNQARYDPHALAWPLSQDSIDGNYPRWFPTSTDARPRPE